MITSEQVPEANKRLLVEFRDYLDAEVPETDVDSCMADISLYAIDYTDACLSGVSVCEINAFDVHCFLADYLIRQLNGCTANRLLAVLDSMSSFCGFLAEKGTIDFLDLYEILAVCGSPEPILARWEAYRELLEERDLQGLAQWRNQVLDCFAI